MHGLTKIIGACIESGSSIKCTDSHVGYHISLFFRFSLSHFLVHASVTDDLLTGFSDSTQLANSLIHGLTTAIILTPIGESLLQLTIYPSHPHFTLPAAALTFIALLLALASHLVSHVLGSVVAGLAAFVTLLALSVDNYFPIWT